MPRSSVKDHAALIRRSLADVRALVEHVSEETPGRSAILVGARTLEKRIAAWEAERPSPLEAAKTLDEALALSIAASRLRRVSS